MCTLGDSLRKLRQERGLTLDKLSHLLNERYQGDLNFNKGKLSKWENGREEPRLSSVKMLTDFYGVDIDQLYPSKKKKNTNIITKTVQTVEQLNDKNQKDVYNYASQKLKEQNAEKTTPNNTLEFKGKVDMNKYPTPINGKVSAGHGFINHDKEKPIKTVYLDRVPCHYDLAFEVDGNSMRPTYSDGEIVFVQKTQDIYNGMLAAIEINNEAFIKKVYFETTRLRLVSLNMERDENGVRLYPDFYADEFDNIHMIGRVLC